MTKTPKVKKPTRLVWGMPIAFVKWMLGFGAWLLGSGIVGAINGSGFSTGLTAFFGTLLIATVCTLGVGAVVMFMVFYLSGAAIFFVISKVFGIQVVSKSALVAMPTTIAPNVQAIAVYIHDAVAYGMSREVITANLKNQGWNVDQINSGFGVVDTIPAKQ